MNKFEAAEHIGVSVRTLMKLVSRGEIHGKKVAGKTGFEYDFAPDEVERVKRDRDAGIQIGAIVRHESQQAARAPLVANLQPIQEAIESFREAISELRGVSLKDKLFLTVDEASEYSGLGKWFIYQAIEDGKLTATKAGPRGSFVIRRADLENFADGVGKGRRTRR